MNSLRELNDFLTSNQIKVKKYEGYKLAVGKDTWTLALGVFYLNGTPQPMKQKDLKAIVENYKKGEEDVRSENAQTRRWRGISCRGRIRD